MAIKSDIEIAQDSKMLPIGQIAEKLNIKDEDLECYGKYKAKINYKIIKNYPDRINAKLILVTAITPTPAGEGKTTTTIGLGDALNKIGKSAIIALREPSIGPVFGMKGGAAGGGYAQVVPMEDINLHFTGDFHAVGAANNLLAAMMDNHIQQGNELGIDVRKITWKRCVDMNDRQLRYIVDGLNGRVNGVPREDGFEITVASEVMAILCLAEDIDDLKERLGNIIVGYDLLDKPVTAGQLKANGAMASLLKDAIKPNLVQTLEHRPAIIHGGPFANIAHGCNSVMATKLAMKLADYVITEAGFGADLGAEKFFNIKCRKGKLKPDAVVIVATVRALKHHGGCAKEDLNKKDAEALKHGMPNLIHHIKNITEEFGLPAVVALNKFPSDTEEEIQTVKDICGEFNVKVCLSEVWEKGSEGGIELAEEVIRITEKENNFKFTYSDEIGIEDKIRSVVKKIYGGADVHFMPVANSQITRIEEMGYGNLPVCIAKTQYSFSDNASLKGSPEGFKITVKNVKISAGAGFVVVYTGDVMTMPGLPKVPAAENIDIDSDGRIHGMF